MDMQAKADLSERTQQEHAAEQACHAVGTRPRLYAEA
jgi:hypothetical protein